MRKALLLGWIAACAGGMASAQPPPTADTLNLICSGTDTALYAMAPGYYGPRSYNWGLPLGETRIAAQLAVQVRDGQVRVRPPKGSVPLFAKKGDDGWYVLSDVAVDRLSIRGRIRFTPVDRATLKIDRRTGEATFGDFSGVCQAAPADPDATKF